MKPIDDPAELDRPWPVKDLLDAVGFRPRVHGRVAEHLQKKGVTMLSAKQLMDLFLPAVLSGYAEIPILRQPQFGKYCFHSGLLSLCDATLGAAFHDAWASRIYSMKVYELRHDPANWPLRSALQETHAAPQ